MPVRVGDLTPTSFRLGPTPVQRLYVGGTLVWERGVVSTYFTRWLSDVIGQPAANWRVYNGRFTHTVEQDAYTGYSERFMRAQKPAVVGKDGIIWDAIPSVADVEVYVEFQSLTTTTLTGRWGAVARFDEVADTLVYGEHGQSLKGRLAFYSPTSGIYKSTETARYPLQTRLRMVYKVVGSAMYFKIWPFGSYEPASWTVRSDGATTDAATATNTPTTQLNAGPVGVIGVGSGTAGNVTDMKVYSVGVGLGTTPAPRSHYPSPIYQQVPHAIQSPIAEGVKTHPAYSMTEGYLLERDGGLRYHRGLDIYLPMYTPVYAMHPGTITSFMPGISEPITPGSGGGYSLYIDSEDKKVRRGYLHLGPNEVNKAAEAFAPGISPGVFVQKGRLLGWSGESGASVSGPHLHTDFRDLAGDVTDDIVQTAADGTQKGADYTATPGSVDAPRFNPYPSIQVATTTPTKFENWAQQYPTFNDLNEPYGGLT